MDRYKLLHPFAPANDTWATFEQDGKVRHARIAFFAMVEYPPSGRGGTPNRVVCAFDESEAELNTVAYTAVGGPCDDVAAGQLYCEGHATIEEAIAAFTKTARS